MGSSEGTQVSGEQIVGGMDAGANLKKRQKKDDAAVVNEGRKGVKRKVILSSTIEDDDVPASSQSPLPSVFTSAPPLSIFPASPPPSHMLPAALGIVPTAGVMLNLPFADPSTPFFTQGTMTADFSSIQLDFSDFPDLDPLCHQDLFQDPSAALH